MKSRRLIGVIHLVGGASFGHTGKPHTLNVAVAPSKDGGIVEQYIGGITKAANGEAWIERKSRLHCGPRFVQLPEPRQRSRKIEMCDGMVSVCVEAPADPEDCFVIGIEVRPGDADP